VQYGKETLQRKRIDYTAADGEPAEQEKQYQTKGAGYEQIEKINGSSPAGYAAAVKGGKRQWRF
jgi:hypothetical protein